MTKDRFYIGMTLLVLLTGCATAPPQKLEKPVLLGTFKGTLPCADCPGIATELTLYENGPNIVEGDYILKETYLDREVKPRVVRGQWTMSRGTPKDDDATVYQLEPDDLKKSSYYLKVNEHQIRQLDREEHEIDPKLNFTLSKQ